MMAVFSRKSSKLESIWMKPLSILQLDIADRAVIRVAGEGLYINFLVFLLQFSEDNLTYTQKKMTLSDIGSLITEGHFSGTPCTMQLL